MVLSICNRILEQDSNVIKIRYKREWEANTCMQCLIKEVSSTKSSTVESPSLSLGIQNGEERFLKKISVKSDRLCSVSVIW